MHIFFPVHCTESSSPYVELLGEAIMVLYSVHAVDILMKRLNGSYMLKGFCGWL